jgi:hypothetical protein
MMKSPIAAALGFIAAVVTVVYLGCAGAATKPLTTPTEPIAHVQSDVKAVATGLAQTTKDIKQNAAEGQKATPPALKPTLDPKWNAITNAATKQDVYVDQLKAKDAELERIKGIANGWVKYADTEKARADKAENSLTDALRKRMHLLVVLGVVGIAISGALVFSGNKIGIATGVGSALLVGTALFIGQTAQLLPWIIGGVAVLCVGLIVWQLIDKRRKFNVASTAAKELVHTVEIAKTLMPVDARKRVFGDGPVPGKAYQVQSESTQKLVSEARAELPNLAPSIAPTAPTEPQADVSSAPGEPSAEDHSWADEVEIPEPQVS